MGRIKTFNITFLATWGCACDFLKFFVVAKTLKLQKLFKFYYHISHDMWLIHAYGYRQHQSNLYEIAITLQPFVHSCPIGCNSRSKTIKQNTWKLGES